VGGDGHTHH
jgi:hypothetical protein